MSGVVVVAAVLATVAFAARHAPVDGDASAETVSETAWLPGPAGVMLADAGHSRPLATVSSGMPIATSVTQAGRSAVVSSGSEAVVIDGRTSRPAGRPTPITGDTFVVAGAGAAWLVAPSAGTARRLDLDLAPDRASEPVEIGAGVTPNHARVTDDGTLWVLGPGDLRAIRPGRPTAVVPLGPRAGEHALTLLAGDPVVIDAHRARHVDPVTTTFDDEWPLDLPDGPITPAQHTDHTVVARTTTRLAMTGPAQPAVSIALDTDRTDQAPVERNGLVFLAREATNEIIALDPHRPTDQRVVRRIPLPGTGDIDLFAHHGRVWYSRQTPNGAGTWAGVITDALDVRLIAPDDAYRSGAPGSEPGGSELASGAEQPADRRVDDPWTDAPPEPSRTVLRPTDDPCVRTWIDLRCRPDGSTAPGSRSGAGAAAPSCPLTWNPADCALGPGDPRDGGDPGAPRGTGDDPLGGPDDTSPRIPPPPPLPPPAGNDLVTVPDVVGKSFDDAARALREADLGVPNRMDRPALQRKGHVARAHLGGRPLDDRVPRGLQIDLDVGDGTKPIRQVAMGDTHLCLVTEDGFVYCRGQNWAGQLGDGTENRDLPGRRIDLPEVQTVAAGSYHSCALLVGGSVRCWGRNEAGQLGFGQPDEDAHEPSEVEGLTGVEEISAGGSHTCARLSGSVWCWGFNTFDEHGRVAAAPRPIKVPGVAGATRIDVGDGYACAVLENRSVSCWGDNRYSQLGRINPVGDPNVPQSPWLPGTVRLSGDTADLRQVAEVSAGAQLACARLVDRTVTCWGYLGTELQSAPTPVDGVVAAVEISVGATHGCARLEGGAVTCWGANFAMQLGRGLVDWWANPADLVPDASPADHVAAGSSSGCAVVKDGPLRCWGQLDQAFARNIFEHKLMVVPWDGP